MSVNCFSCSEPVSNAEFIKCEGICAATFHSKCVSLNKTTLNAIASCPNVHWMCNECNIGGKTISRSIDDMRTAVDCLTKSLTSDLLSGFKMLTDTLATTIASNHQSSISSGRNVFNPSKRRREEESNSSDCDDEQYTMKKSFKGNAIVSHNMVAAHDLGESRKSIVISNIDKEIAPGYLTKYLSRELGVEESEIRATLLKPVRLAESDIKFLQYRISVPLSVYSIAKMPETWPIGVKVRDYIYNRNRNNVVNKIVSKESFLSKRICHSGSSRERNHHQPTPETPMPTEIVPSTAQVNHTVTIDLDELPVLPVE